MVRFRALLALLVGLALASASLTASVARVDAAGAMQVAICTGYGMTTLLVDSEGRPVAPTHPCPKCLAGMMAAALPETVPLPARPVSDGRAARLDRLALPGAIACVRPCARGPPWAAT